MLNDIKQDYRAYNMTPLTLAKDIITLGTFTLVASFRLSHWLYLIGTPVLPGIITLLQRICYGASICPTATIRGGLIVAHSVGIVIGPGVTIGRNCRIYHGVTLGEEGTKAVDGRTMPILGDDVCIFAGAVIIGAINIGNKVVIGANAVVVKDAPDNVLLGGIPARTIKTNYDWKTRGEQTNTHESFAD